jgi:hypothetical protein
VAVLDGFENHLIQSESKTESKTEFKAESVILSETTIMKRQAAF